MRQVILDTNLLVLLVVGTCDRKLIASHKRTKAFEDADYELLLTLLSGVTNVLVSPNVLTETSNLIAQTAEHEVKRLRETLSRLCGKFVEVYIESAVAFSSPFYNRVGLTDAALLQIAGKEMPVLTVDVRLYLAALELNLPVLNFNHERQARLLNV